MKKFFSLLILPIVALLCLCACDSDKSYEDVKKLYEQTTSVCVVEEDNKFFADASRPNSITIKYTSDVESAINNVSPVTSLQKKYVVIGYQQKLLDYIYNYYEQYNENFYKEISSAKPDKKEMNALYSSLSSLNATLTSFKKEYLTFCDATQNGVTSVMEFNLTNYSYEFNKVINSSLNFMYNFISMNEKYCIKDYNLINATNIEYRIAKSYVDIANIVYLTNFKAFDYSVGSKGISDMTAIISSTNKYSIAKDLESVKTLSTTILAGMDEESSAYNITMSTINDYLYANEIFNQRLNTYLQIYNSEDIYNLTQYKFDLVQGVDYESYLSTLTKSKQSTINFMDDFILDIYAKLVDNLALMVA